MIEGRICLISVLLLSISIYVSNFNYLISSIVIALVAILMREKVLKLLLLFVPVIFIVLISSLLVSIEHAVITTMAFTALISTGSLVYHSDKSEIAGALLYFKIPEKIVSLLSFAVAMFPILYNDFKNIKLVQRGYCSLVKSFISTVILRSLSFSESLYIKSFNYKAIYSSRNPGKFDIILLMLCVGIFALSVNLKFLHVPYWSC
ncbi:hypothetical protein B6U96_14555 [Archaeoglobales archaeon ex4484_92]|nr:MAG: hypothetical protein B6U96_14555 [Archaeoglobales archaeon ex4484_92]